MSGQLIPPPARPLQLAEPRWLVGVNAEALTVPGRGVVKVNGYSDARSVSIYRPDADSMDQVMVAGPAGIPASARAAVSGDWPLWAAFSGSTPSTGDEVGTVSGAYTVATGKKGFRVLAVDSVGGFVLITPAKGAGSCGWAVGDIKLSYTESDQLDTPTGFWWLFCDGGSFSSSDYPDLYSLLGGTTLPDSQARHLVGAYPGSSFNLGSSDGQTVGNRAVTMANGLHHYHDTVYVTGYTSNSADASSATTDEATATSMGPYFNVCTDNPVTGHVHGIPADAFQHHTHGWTCSGAHTGYEYPNAFGTVPFPSYLCVGVLILAKKS